jgi:hypothetical protein
VTPTSRVLLVFGKLESGVVEGVTEIPDWGEVAAANAAGRFALANVT